MEEDSLAFLFFRRASKDGNSAAEVEAVKIDEPIEELPV